MAVVTSSDLKYFNPSKYIDDPTHIECGGKDTTNYTLTTVINQAKEHAAVQIPPHNSAMAQALKDAPQTSV